MDLDQMREALRRRTIDAVSRGSVRLASGKISDFYIDGRRVTLDPKALFYIARLMADGLDGVDFDAVGGPTIGADPIVGALLYHFWVTEQKPIAGFIIRKEAKTHGLQKLIEGPQFKAGARVVLVEDVVTSGGSVLKAARVVEAADAKVVKILALVDREEGAGDTFAAAGYDFAALFKRRELE